MQTPPRATRRCPLCKGEKLDLFFEDRQRRYVQCMCCSLVFVPDRYWLSREDEKAVYDLHENHLQDPGYRKFLSRLSLPVLKKLDSKQRGLDFGCGPGPALPVLFEEKGHQMDLYDPIYINDPSVFNRMYDFICATEVVEHFRNPDKDFTALFNMLKQGGWLGIMTKLVINKRAFSKWHYIRDMTHICFYSRSTFGHIARLFDANLTFIADDVILLQKR